MTHHFGGFVHQNLGVFELGPPNRSLHKTRHEMAGLGLLFGMYPTPPSQSLDVMTYSFRNCKARMISFKLHDCQSMAYTLTGPLTPDSAEAQSFIASSPPSPPVAIYSPRFFPTSFHHSIPCSLCSMARTGRGGRTGHGPCGRSMA